LHGWGPEGLDTLRPLEGEVGFLTLLGTWQSGRIIKI